VAVRRGDHDVAESLARDAVRLARETDLLAIQGDALVDLADVLAELGRRSDAAEALAEASALYERKGHTEGAARARARLGELAAANPA
jgi:hypothetical protein